MASEVNLVTFEILSFFDVFWQIFNESVRKRKRIARHETYAKRRVDMCSLDQYGLGRKRMFKFSPCSAKVAKMSLFHDPRKFGARS